jgi:tRNA pseudouridine38-40 synthase
MTRVALGLEYDGTGFSGWQLQSHARTVQGELQAALSSVAARAVAVTAAGRTDAGVHAVGQVAHFDTTVLRAQRAWVLGANSQSGADLRVLWAREVDELFHARYSALSRTYRYLILDHPIRPALDRLRVCWSRRPLDAAAMHEAAQILVGEHDFAAFRAAECQSRSSVRRLSAITAVRRDGVVAITVRANAFLHHMVRNIAGALIAIGTGDRSASWLGSVLGGRDRHQGGVTAPAHGLYLTAVEYPAEFGLPTDSAAEWMPTVCPSAFPGL